VARVLARLGANAIALYPSGGYTGKVLDKLIEKEHITAIPVETQNETRESIIVLETSTHKQFRFTMPATELSEGEVKKMLGQIEQVEQIDFVVVSGSLPASLPADIFSQIDIIAR